MRASHLGDHHLTGWKIQRLPKQTSEELVLNVDRQNRSGELVFESKFTAECGRPLSLSLCLDVEMIGGASPFAGAY